MIHTMDCQANITAQDANHPTYKKVDCTLHINANDDNFYGRLIDCSGSFNEFAPNNVDFEYDEITVTVDIATGRRIMFTTTGILPAPLVIDTVYYAIRVDATHIKVATTLANADAEIAIDLTNAGTGTHTVVVLMIITTLLVAACRSLDQGIRLLVTIDGVDVSDALIGGFNIQHNKNKISTCSLNLGDIIYSPRTNSHIDLEKEIVVTAYINQLERKLFTGLLDEPSAENTPKFKVIISGRDYGKLLLDKRMTLISVQDTAVSTKRNDVVKYLAEQAGVTNVDIPEMDPVTIDNSFQHQSIWDMIQKEAMIELYWVKFSEDNIMQLKLDEIKSDLVLYPTPDWSYNEDKFVRLSYKRTRIEFNKIAIMGATAKSRIPTVEDVISNQLSYRKSWSSGTPQDAIEEIDGEIQGDFTIRTVWAGQDFFALRFRTEITWTEADFEFIDYNFTGDNVNLDYKSLNPAGGYLGFVWAIHRTEPAFITPAQAGAILISIQGLKRVTTYETRYDQISARITDPNSIAKYGERDGGSIEYPLIETQEQCAAVGKKIIRSSHKIGVGIFEIPFNPLMRTGETVGLSDKKIGLTQRFLIEGVGHNGTIDDEGKIKVRTVVVGVHYA